MKPTTKGLTKPMDSATTSTASKYQLSIREYDPQPIKPALTTGVLAAKARSGVPKKNDQVHSFVAQMMAPLPSTRSKPISKPHQKKDLASNVTSSAFDSYINKMFNPASELQSKLQTAVVKQIVMEASHANEMTKSVDYSTQVMSGDQSITSERKQAHGRPGKIVRVNTKKFDLTESSDLNDSSTSMNKYISFINAEKTKSLVLDKLARKYSPKHERPGQSQQSMPKKSFQINEGLESPTKEMPPTQDGLASKPKANDDVTIVNVGVIRKASNINQSMLVNKQKMLQLKSRADRPKSSRYDSADKDLASKHTFLSSYHKQKTTSKDQKMAAMPKRTSELIRPNETSTDMQQHHNITALQPADIDSPFSPDLLQQREYKYQEFSTQKNFQNFYRRQETPESSENSEQTPKEIRLKEENEDEPKVNFVQKYLADSITANERNKDKQHFDVDEIQKLESESSAEEQQTNQTSLGHKVISMANLLKDPPKDRKKAMQHKSILDSGSLAIENKKVNANVRQVNPDLVITKKRSETIMDHHFKRIEHKPNSDYATNKPDTADPKSGPASIEFLLRFLLREEELLSRISELATQGSFLEIQKTFLPYFYEQLYSDIFAQTSLAKQRPRVFAAQLNIYVFLVLGLVEILVLSPLIRKHASTLAYVLFLNHQSFLLMIELILQTCVETQLEKNIEFKLLKHILDKNFAGNKINATTALRQHNEQIRCDLRKIANDLVELKGNEGYAYNEFGQQMIDSLKLSLDENAIDPNKNKDANEKILDCSSKITMLTSQSISHLKIIQAKQQKTDGSIRHKSVQRSQLFSEQKLVRGGLQDDSDDNDEIDELRIRQDKRREIIKSHAFDQKKQNTVQNQQSEEEISPQSAKKKLETVEEHRQETIEEQKLDTVEELFSQAHDSPEPERINTATLMSPTIVQNPSSDKTDGFNDARNMLGEFDPDPTKVYYEHLTTFKDRVSETKKRKMADDPLMTQFAKSSTKGSPIQHEDRPRQIESFNVSKPPMSSNKTASLTDKFTQASQSESSMLQENIAFLIANALQQQKPEQYVTNYTSKQSIDLHNRNGDSQNHTALPSRQTHELTQNAAQFQQLQDAVFGGFAGSVQLVNNINNNINIYGKIAISPSQINKDVFKKKQPVQDLSSSYVQESKLSGKLKKTLSQSGSAQLKVQTRNDQVAKQTTTKDAKGSKQIQSPTTPAKSGIGSGIKNIKKSFADARESLKSKQMTKQPGQKQEPAIDGEPCPAYPPLQRNQSTNEIIRKGRQQRKSTNKLQKQPKIEVPEDDEESPIMLSPRPQKRPSKPERTKLQFKIMPLTKQLSNDTPQVNNEMPPPALEITEPCSVQENIPFDVAVEDSEQPSETQVNSNFGSAVTKLVDTPWNIKETKPFVPTLKVELIEKVAETTAKIELNLFEPLTALKIESANIGIEEGSPMSHRSQGTPLVNPMGMLEKMFQKQRKQTMFPTLMTDANQEEIKQEMMRQHQVESLKRRESKISLSHYKADKAAFTQTHKRQNTHTNASAASLVDSPNPLFLDYSSSLKLRPETSLTSFVDQEDSPGRRDRAATCKGRYQTIAEKLRSAPFEELRLSPDSNLPEQAAKQDRPDRPTMLAMIAETEVNDISVHISNIDDTPNEMDRADSFRIGESDSQLNGRSAEVQSQALADFHIDRQDGGIKPYIQSSRKATEVSQKLKDFLDPAFVEAEDGEVELNPPLDSTISCQQTEPSPAVRLQLISRNDEINDQACNSSGEEIGTSEIGFRLQQPECELDDDKLLQLEIARLRETITVPFLPPISQDIIDDGILVYTLVLDLDETLIHFDEDDPEGAFYVRPGAVTFLQELSFFFEIVVFTAAMPDYADKILDNLDPDGRMVSHRLYRQHTTPKEDYAIKDLNLLGRPLERTIIIDNLRENFQETTPNNGIWVESWYRDMDDRVLPRLQPFLIQIAEQEVEDVRTLLTDQIKENIIYECLERNKPIPHIADLLK